MISIALFSDGVADGILIVQEHLLLKIQYVTSTVDLQMGVEAAVIVAATGKACGKRTS
jgi:hypothetical protein